jgi:hypothetical protein
MTEETKKEVNLIDFLEQAHEEYELWTFDENNNRHIKYFFGRDKETFTKCLSQFFAAGQKIEMRIIKCNLINPKIVK